MAVTGRAASTPMPMAVRHHSGALVNRVARMACWTIRILVDSLILLVRRKPHDGTVVVVCVGSFTLHLPLEIVGCATEP